MAYKVAGLALLSSALDFGDWLYRTDDAAAAVAAEGYFNLAKNELNVGDRVFIQADWSGAKSYAMAVVVQNDGTTVDLADLTAIGGSDSA